MPYHTSLAKFMTPDLMLVRRQAEQQRLQTAVERFRQVERDLQPPTPAPPAARGALPIARAVLGGPPPITPIGALPVKAPGPLSPAAQLIAQAPASPIPGLFGRVGGAIRDIPQEAERAIFGDLEGISHGPV